MRTPKEIIDILLEERGLIDPDDVAEYLSPRPKATYDPFRMLGMREGVDLILSVADAGGRICVYGDYDADGVTSIGILYDVLSEIVGRERLSWYIPSRFTEGYGLNTEAVERIAAGGTDLLITVDCGVTSVREVERAKELGMQVLVTDHHEPSDRLPETVVIDPKQEGETYPFRQLAGCGVAFKLLQALQRERDLPRSIITEALDLVAIGTVADVVPLTDENRTIVKYGLIRLNQAPRPPIRALIEGISIHKVTSERIGFGIGPHINAAGRMGSAGDAMELILAGDRETILRQVERLKVCNRERREAQDNAFARCEEKVRGDEDIVILRVDGIHEGVAGNAAGRLKEDLYRPVLLATPTGDGLLKGTGRSIPGVHIREALDRHRDLFLRFGGHEKACGFTMKEELFPRLKEEISRDIAILFAADPEITSGRWASDLELLPAEATLGLVDALEVMEPFGEGNPLPRFSLPGVRIVAPSFRGENGNHVSFLAERDGGRVPCILFKKARKYADLITGTGRVTLIGGLEKKTWNGNTTVQFNVKEIIAENG